MSSLTGFPSLSADSSRSIKIWDVAGRTVRSDLRGHTDKIDLLAWSSADSLLVSASQDTTLRVWEVESGIALHALQLEGIYRLIGSPRHHFIVVLFEEEAMIYNAKSGEPTRFSHGCAEAALAPDGTSLLTFNYQKEGLKVWDLRSLLGHPRKSIDLPASQERGALLSSTLMGGPQVGTHSF